MSDKAQHPKILYCHCAYAQVVPAATKDAVLRHLTTSGCAFDSVADLCEMSARQDATLKKLAQEGPLKIVACFPRAVKWLFAASGAALPIDATQVLNMRTETPEDLIASLNRAVLDPNLPAGKETIPNFTSASS